MTDVRKSRFTASCSCGACGPSAGEMSRRQFLCTSAAGAMAAPALAATIATPPAAPQAPPASGRAILIKGGCVLSLDRAVGDFNEADVLIEGGKISAVRPN